MKTRLRAKVAAAAVAIVAAGVLALFVSGGPAVAFFSGGLFLDVHVESPATLVARGAAVDVPLEVTCNAAPGTSSVSVTVSQKAGSGVAQGSGSTSVGCTGSGQQIRVRVLASGAKTFKQGIAVATANVFGCTPNFSVCGEETDSQTITIQR
jgi:hypothetical protein